MASSQHTNSARLHAKNKRTLMIIGFILLAALAMPGVALAQFQDTETSVCNFFGNANNILNMISITVVTIAVVFSGYQIGFAHKRIGDVAPVLIGGVLIGAAGQVAKWLVPSGQTCTATAMVVQHFLHHYA